MLVYASMLIAPALVREAMLICKELNFQTCDLEPTARPKDTLVAVFESAGNFPKHKLLCCSNAKFGERKIVVPGWAARTTYCIALNEEYGLKCRHPETRVRLTDALREANRVLTGQMNSMRHVKRSAFVVAQEKKIKQYQHDVLS